MAKKSLCLVRQVSQVTSSSSQVVEQYKTLLWKEAGMIIFFGWMPKLYFFQLPKLNKYCLGVELALVHNVKKKLKMDHPWVDKLYRTTCRNGHRMW